MWPRGRILRRFTIVLGIFLATQLIIFFFLSKEVTYEKDILNTIEYQIKRDNTFIPKCVKDNEFAYSAVNRSTSEECRTNLSYLACTRLEKKTITLPRSCPFQNQLFENKPAYLGCFSDKHDDRDLEDGFFRLSNTNTPELCRNTCLNHGASLAGVQYGVECYCGGNPHRLYGRLPEKRCDMPCPGNKQKNCGGYLSQRIFQTGIKGPIRHYAQLVDPENYELDVRKRIVYLLILNGRGWRQIKRLFKLIYHVNHYFYIHVDKRRNYLHGQVQTLVKMYPNVRIAPWRMSTIWGGSSLLRMVLKAFDDLLNMDDWHWDYVINLSESDLPVKTDNFLTAYLTHNAEQNFLKSHGQKSKSFVMKQGMDRLFYECDEHLWLLGNRKLPQGIIMDGGSDWVALYRSFVGYAVHSNDDLVRGLKDYFQYSLLPVESFFHTLAQNSRFCNSVIDNNLHFTNWDRSKGCQCQQRNIVDWCGCSPAVIRTTDLPKLKGTRPRPIFFARKFDPVVDQEIINNLEEMLYGRTTFDETSMVSYWESLYHPTLDRGHDHDLKRSFLSGLLTIVGTELDPLSARCSGIQIDWNEPGESHVYFVRGRVEGVLVRVRMFGANDGPSVWTELFMTRVDPVLRRTKPASTEASLLSRRLRSIQIGSSYDPKENMFRNYANVLGPNSTITVRHEWGPGEETRVHFLWIDPGSHPAILLRVVIPATKSHRSSFNLEVDYLPLQAGWWRVDILDSTGMSIAKLKFLIQPMTFNAGLAVVDVSTARRLNCGPPYHRYSKTPVDPTVATVDPAQVQRAERECSLTGEDLMRHTARLLAAEWSLREWCVSSQLSGNTNLIQFQQQVCRTVDRCEDTAWSSQAPDPKSELRPVNGQTGRIVGD